MNINCSCRAHELAFQYYFTAQKAENGGLRTFLVISKETKVIQLDCGRHSFPSSFVKPFVSSFSIENSTSCNECLDETHLCWIGNGSDQE